MIVSVTVEFDTQPHLRPKSKHNSTNIQWQYLLNYVLNCFGLIQPVPRSVYAEIDENRRNEVPMDVRGVMLQCVDHRGLLHKDPG